MQLSHAAIPEGFLVAVATALSTSLPICYIAILLVVYFVLKIQSVKRTKFCSFFSFSFSLLVLGE